MDRLLTMKVFARVVETGSFARAAQGLDIPAPTVSRLVQTLEAHLGARLLNRTTRSVTITDEGFAYYERCVQVLSEIEDMEAEVGKSRRSPGGRLRIGLPATVAKNILIPALPGFVAAYPDIRLNLDISDRLADLVGDGLDCAIRVGAIVHEGVAAKRIGEVRNMLCAAPSYLEKHGEPQSLEDLQEHVAVSYVSNVTGRTNPWNFVVDEQPHAIHMKSAIMVNDGDSYMACGLAGMGIISGPSYTLQKYVESGALRRILPQYQVAARPINVIYVPNRHLPRKTRVFIDWVADIFQKYTDAET